LADVSTVNWWEVCEIPDANCLFLRIHLNHWKRGRIAPSAFHPWGDGLSTDWCRYSSQAETILRVGDQETTKKDGYKKPESYGVAAMSVKGVRNIPILSVRHTPNLENMAHAEIFGSPPCEPGDDDEVRVKLRRLCFENPHGMMAPGTVDGVTFAGNAPDGQASSG
jgi:hypothetical protein